MKSPRSRANRARRRRLHLMLRIEKRGIRWWSYDYDLYWAVHPADAWRAALGSPLPTWAPEARRQTARAALGLPADPPPAIDDEKLAALLAGNLTEKSERDRVLSHLSVADEDYEVFADTAGILREMEAEDAADGCP